MRKNWLLSLASLLLCPVFALGQAVIRGPYLQNANQNAITVKWRTDSLTDSRVQYGSTPGNLNRVATDATVTTEHTVRISGLWPDSTYYYSVGSTVMDLEGGDNSHHFHTNPPTGLIRPYEFWVLGDFGRGTAQEYWVRDQYYDYASSHGLSDAWIWLGDNAYYVGADSEYTKWVFNVYDSLFSSLIFWPTPGNHDYYSVNATSLPPYHTGPYYSIVDVPTHGEAGGFPSGGEMYYSFNYGNVHFISLNSEIGSWIFSNNTPLTWWLESDLQANTLPWTVVYFHQPPHSKGTHSSDNFTEVNMIAMRSNIAPILEQYGVDLVLTGHCHNYERSKLVYGFYDYSWNYNSSYEVDGGGGHELQGQPYRKALSGAHPNRGTVYSVVGNGGSVGHNPPLNHPMMETNWGCDTCAGSMLIKVNNDTMRVEYWTSEDSLLDEFAIYKDLYVGDTEPTIYQLGVHAWPNPFSDEVQLTILMPDEARLVLSLTDMMGHELVRESLGSLAAGTHRVDLGSKVRNLAAGTYLVRVSDGKRSTVSRLVKGGQAP
ncbi:MAG: metallophosphoesterase [Bacteroidia bacterium]